ncbi:twin-arginine translocase TatA/TatE family subunit [Haloterrigena salinisoli]|uniref:Sec-independent protein translocase subunit TatA/TatB n=1 Tax=Haloterrigena salinisoli TaxID=3132747 RepID=UPI00387E812E
MTSIAPLFVPGMPGGPELLIIVGVAILLFGAQKIPKLARSIGESTGEFKKGQAKVEQELEEYRRDAAADVDVETEPATETQS